jgi:hypothetical protein
MEKRYSEAEKSVLLSVPAPNLDYAPPRTAEARPRPSRRPVVRRRAPRVARDIDGWLGYVRYGVSPGLRYLEWVAAERVRPTQSLGAGRYVRARQSS